MKSQLSDEQKALDGAVLEFKNQNQVVLAALAPEFSAIERIRCEAARAMRWLTIDGTFAAANEAVREAERLQADFMVRWLQDPALIACQYQMQKLNAETAVIAAKSASAVYPVIEACQAAESTRMQILTKEIQLASQGAIMTPPTTDFNSPPRIARSPSLAQELFLFSLAFNQRQRRESPSTLNGDEAESEFTSSYYANTFALEGVLWKVRFGEQEAIFPNRKGFALLAVLLRNPNRNWAAEDLLREVHHESAPCELITRQQVMDPETLSDLGSRRQRLACELARAEDYNDPERAAALSVQLEELNQYAIRALDLRGRVREMSTNAERARKSVTNAIRRALALLKETHPALHDHLHRTVHLGLRCIYAPGFDILWNT